MMETVGEYGQKYFFEFLLIDATISLIFAAEYMYRFFYEYFFHCLLLYQALYIIVRPM